MIKEDNLRNDLFVQAINAGTNAILLTGNVHDLILTDSKLAYHPQHVAEMFSHLGFHVIRYAKSQGCRVHGYCNFDPEDKKALDKRLNAVGLQQLINRNEQLEPDEIRRFFRAIARLMQTPCSGDAPIALILDYAEHICPAVQTSAAAADEQTIAAETVHILALAPALNKSGNKLICIVRDGHQNILLNDGLKRVSIPFPNEQQTQSCIEYLLSRKDEMEEKQYGNLAEGFSPTEFARLTRGLRLREIEVLLKEAKTTNKPLDRSRVLQAKADAIVNTSEGTLNVMATSLQLEDVIGLNVIKHFFVRIAQLLKSNAQSSPRAILMAGPPGTSKSTFAPILSSLCGFNIVKFEQIKNMFVGESERRLNLALSVVESLAPVILFIDEITECVPSRNGNMHDGGVSLDLLAQLFQFSARDDLRGKVLLLAATNVPEKLDAAWHDRFIIVPFLELMPEESVHLFAAFEKRITSASTLDASDASLNKASEILHEKGASPRKIFDVVNHALLHASAGSLTSTDILKAAQDYVGAANPFAIAYTSLSAIALTSFYSLLPWSDDPENYSYPWYMENIVDRKTGNLDRQLLQQKIREFHRQANI
ncbi:MAG: ATP-binding protein [Deferribacteres bacterium]|nr:ATP-binding protein [candidate division KSB1 bacterium]MCB9503251.1 ATP-binding protein [Deferribacteres bacterium]